MKKAKHQFLLAVVVIFITLLVIPWGEKSNPPGNITTSSTYVVNQNDPGTPNTWADSVAAQFEVYGPDAVVQRYVLARQGNTIISSSDTASIAVSGGQYLGSAKVKNLAGSTTYEFTVYVIDTSGVIWPSNPKMVTTAPDPTPMTATLTNPFANANAISFTLNYSAIGYSAIVEPQYRIANSGAPFTVGTAQIVSGQGQLGMTVAPVLQLTMYEVRVKMMINGTVPGIPSVAFSQSIYVTTPGITYAAVTDPQVASGIDTARVTTYVSLGTSPSANIIVRRFLNNVFQTQWSQTVNASGWLSHTFTGLTPDTTYGYDVIAVDNPNADTTARVLSSTHPVPAPTITLDSLITTKTTATLYITVAENGTWTQSQAMFDGLWAIGFIPPPLTYGPFPVNGTSQQFVLQKTGLQPGTTHSFIAHAVNSDTAVTQTFNFSTKPPYASATVNINTASFLHSVASIKVIGINVTVPILGYNVGNTADIYRYVTQSDPNDPNSWTDSVYVRTMTTSGTLNDTITPLTPLGTYHIKYAAFNGDGIKSESACKTRTLTIAPTVPNVTVSVNSVNVDADNVILYAGGETGGNMISIQLQVQDPSNSQFVMWSSPVVPAGPDLIDYQASVPAGILADGHTYEGFVLVTNSPNGNMSIPITFCTTGTNGLTEIPTKDVSVYPVPAQPGEMLNISGMPIGMYSIQLFDAQGRLVLNEKVTGTPLQAVAPNVAPGTYVLWVIGEKHFAKKIITIK